MRVLVIQNTHNEGLGLLYKVVDRNIWEVDLRIMDTGSILPENMDGFEAMVILGGPMSAYQEDAYPYLGQVQTLIREAAVKSIPTLGICLGAQLIARALGAQVKPNSVKEIGWYEVQLTLAGRQNQVFDNMPSKFPAFQWHGDTFAVPRGAALLAEGYTCRNQAFVYNDTLWAIQFHLEVTPSIIERWATVWSHELPESERQPSKEDLLRETAYLWEQTRQLREQYLKNIAALFYQKAWQLNSPGVSNL